MIQSVRPSLCPEINMLLASLCSIDNLYLQKLLRCPYGYHAELS
ncbi:hypothetical protein NEOC95_001989 [Neochlamydia sp. AcF95]|nr:hypothetical protein [Neochlamydia sp. AcF95]